MNTASIKVVSLNILSDLTCWDERKSMIVDELETVRPDLVALQEVALPENTARWLGERLGLQVYLQPKTGAAGEKEGIAILTRLPVQQHDWLDLGSQNRVAQRVLVQHQGKTWVFANGHFFWHPGPSPDQTAQVERLLQWLAPFESEAVVACGDFNAQPEFQAVMKMRQQYSSAYASVHGHEPEYTYPTPLKRSAWSQIKAVLSFAGDIRLSHLSVALWGTLDYIFVNKVIKTLDSQLLFNKPHPQKNDLFASDHFGLYAELTAG